MADSTRIRGMNVERIVGQILNAMEDDDEEIKREIENSDSDFSDEDYQINSPPSLGSHYSDTEAVIPCLTDFESESDDQRWKPVGSTGTGRVSGRVEILRPVEKPVEKSGGDSSSRLKNRSNSPFWH